MGIFNLFRRHQEDTATARKARLLRTGRIAEGSIFDVGTDETGAVTHIFYHYEIGGSEYESSQALDDEQRLRLNDFAPGSRITLRVDPRQPTNSIVV
ncbi:hypothetical protein BH18ACI2_BH18ACI2_09070 [soil metagenome]